jgi:hypothetical protein
MMSECSMITRKGKQMLKSGEANMLSPLHHLLLVMFERIDDDVSIDNMISMAQQLVGRFGSPNTAIDAINRGLVGFAKAN